MYAIIKTGGKQYRVEKGDIINIEKIEPKRANAKKIVFDEVLLTSDGKKTEVGTPFLKDVVVEGKILEQGKSDKVIVYKYKAKKDYRRKQGHRQPFTKIEITKVGAAPAKKVAAKKDEAPAKETAKKTTAKKTTAAKKAAPKKTASKKTTAKKAAPKKETAKKDKAE